MQGYAQDINRLTLQPQQSTYMLATVRLKVQQPRNYTFGINSTVPPPTDAGTVMQRGERGCIGRGALNAPRSVAVPARSVLQTPSIGSL